MEALLSVVLQAESPRFIDTLSQNPQAKEIIGMVLAGPFGRCNKLNPATVLEIFKSSGVICLEKMPSPIEDWQDQLNALLKDASSADHWPTLVPNNDAVSPNSYSHIDHTPESDQTDVDFIGSQEFPKPANLYPSIFDEEMVRWSEGSYV